MGVDPRPAGPPGIGGPARRRAALGRAWIAGVLVALEVGMVALMVAAYRWARESATGLGSAPFLIVGTTAAVGIGVLIVILAANLSAARAIRTGRPLASAHGLATLGQWLAVGRLLALVGAVLSTAVARGGEWGDFADVGLICFAGIAALFTALLAIATGRGTTP